MRLSFRSNGKIGIEGKISLTGSQSAIPFSLQPREMENQFGDAPNTMNFPENSAESMNYSMAQFLKSL